MVKTLTGAKRVAKRLSAPFGRFYSGIELARSRQVPVASWQLGLDRTRFDWSDGKTSTFDNAFLLDHCRCSQCFHPVTKQRLRALSKTPNRPTISNIEGRDESLSISWNDGHRSDVPPAFLREAAYDPPIEPLTPDPFELWNGTTEPPRVSGRKIVDDTTHEAEVLNLLDQVHEVGFCLVTDLVVDAEFTKTVIERIAPIRNTHYGGFWDFTADMSHGDLAYSNEQLPAHTDTTYFTDPAGLQIFHLLQHDGQGGETQLVDGFRIASLLKSENEDHYNALSTLPVTFHASGSSGVRLRPLFSQPVLRHDVLGQLRQVRWNNEDRGVLGRGWTPQQIRIWYAAAKRFEELIKQEEYSFSMRPGTMLVINNWRVMHGRSAFSGKRRMCGAYIGADDWMSRRAWLRNGPSSTWDCGW